MRDQPLITPHATRAPPPPSATQPLPAPLATNDGPVDVRDDAVTPAGPTQPSAAVPPSTPPPRPFEPPCKLTKGATLDEPFAPSFDVWPPARALLGLPSAVAARIPVEGVQRQVRERFSCFRGCYHQGLARKPDLQGRVVVDFTIDGANGKVKAVVDRGSTLPDKAVIACILEEMKLVRFPSPGGKDVRIVYPLHFVPPRGQ